MAYCKIRPKLWKQNCCYMLYTVFEDFAGHLKTLVLLGTLVKKHCPKPWLGFQRAPNPVRGPQWSKHCKINISKNYDGT